MDGVVISGNVCTGYVTKRVLLGSLRNANIHGNKWMTDQSVDFSSGTGNVFADNVVMTKGVYALIVLFVLKGGVLTPIFTGNALPASGPTVTLASDF